MAKINYGPPASNPTDRLAITRREALGPGMMMGMSQRSAELVTSDTTPQTRQR